MWAVFEENTLLLKIYFETITSPKNAKMLIILLFFIYQHFYKKRQAETGERSKKWSAALLSWTFAI